jgi:FixJ family two-component response regulator
MRTGSPRIAIVENDVATSVALGRLLRAQGFTVEIFHSAESYLERPGDERIDCLLLDINLDGMSGLELQRSLQSGEDMVPIIFMTGRHDPLAEKNARAHGCAGFLYKPLESPLLANTIENALRSPAA